MFAQTLRLDEPEDGADADDPFQRQVNGRATAAAACFLAISATACFLVLGSVVGFRLAHVHGSRSGRAFSSDRIGSRWSFAVPSQRGDADRWRHLCGLASLMRSVMLCGQVFVVHRGWDHKLVGRPATQYFRSALPDVLIVLCPACQHFFHMEVV